MNKKKIRISAVIMSAVMLASGCSSDNGNSSALSESNTSKEPETTAATSSSTTKAEETTPVSTTKTPETTTATTTTTPNETKKPETTTSVVTTKAPETTVVTTTTTKGPEWTEEKVSGTKYIAETCYSRKKAVIGSDAIKQYFMGDSVKVTAKTNTGYFKLDNGEFIHGDYLSDTKVEPPKQISNEEFNEGLNSKPEETTAPVTSNNTNYGKTNSGDEILGYTGNGDAIIGYIPDIDMPFIGEGKDEHGEYYIIGWSSDGTPIIYYKDPELIIDDTSMGHIDWES